MVVHHVEEVLILEWEGICSLVPSELEICPTQYSMCLIRLGLAGALCIEV